MMMANSAHPYRDLPRYRFWRDVSAQDYSDLDPVLRSSLQISAKTKIATAGSCFAQHIARNLSNRGFTYLVTEGAHPLLPATVANECGYGLFSARFGNVYTAQQLLQLFQRAFGKFQPVEDCWIEESGEVLDPFRPRVEPHGFASEREMRLDRQQHLAAVRRMFEEADVFIFTLGLTEGYISSIDGAAFPLCPGTAGGVFDPDRHRFVNYTAPEVTASLTEFVEGLREVNPDVAVLLTVSPVALVATAVDRHVMVSTSYSKAVLRVAAETMTQTMPNVHYFPSYEIITGAYNRGHYFGPDCREVTEAGVQHVMRLFFKHVCSLDIHAPGETGARVELPNTPEKSISEQISQAVCDEILLDAAR